jgi:hypothetical protein
MKKFYFFNFNLFFIIRLEFIEIKLKALLEQQQSKQQQQQTLN